MRKIIISLILLIVPGCSAVESLKTANTLNLLIDTPRVEGAECAISDKTGRKWNLWETPGTVAIQEGHPPLVIICTKKGFKKSVLTINEHKEELLTIDGKRIDLSVFGDFPTRFPRLIPSAIKEVSGFAQDPTGSISTTYPNQVVVWMEPKKWESEEQMREWAFDREVQDRSDFISEEEAKLTEEQRKEKRRADQKERKDYMNKVKKRLQNAGKKGVKNTLKVLNPAPAVNSVIDTGREVLNPGKALEKSRNSLDNITDTDNSKVRRSIKGAGEEVKSGAEKTINAINPGSAVDFLNKRNKTRDAIVKSRENENEINPEDENTGMYDSEKLPQDLYDTENSQPKSKFRYDENGRRIVQ